MHTTFFLDLIARKPYLCNKENELKLMKRVIAILSIFTLFIALSSCEKEPDLTGGRPVTLKRVKAGCNRPHQAGAPVESVHAYIYEGYVSITFEEPEGMAEVAIKDEQSKVCDSASASTEEEITLSAPLNVGVFSLEISTTLGNYYIGYFSRE